MYAGSFLVTTLGERWHTHTRTHTHTVSCFHFKSGLGSQERSSSFNQKMPFKSWSGKWNELQLDNSHPPSALTNHCIRIVEHIIYYFKKKTHSCLAWSYEINPISVTQGKFSIFAYVMVSGIIMKIILWKFCFHCLHFLTSVFVRQVNVCNKYI